MISIIIPTLNRSVLLSKTLESIFKQNSLDGAEIIVIDNGSNDNTKIIVEGYLKLISCLKYAYNDIPGLLTCRHLGVELASGEILCFIDDDVELNPDYVPNVIKLFNTHENIHFATGPNLPKYEVNPPQWLSSFWETTKEGKYCSWLSLLDFGDSNILIDPNFVWGLNFCCRKATVLKLGGFHPDCIDPKLQKYQGDGETGLTIKASTHGYKAIYSPGLHLFHLISASRLKIEYFEERAFYQGVCDSFTALRKSNGIPSNKRLELKSKLRLNYKKLKLFFKKDTPQNRIEKLFFNLIQKQKAGYEFHQKQFYDNEKIRKWVLKGDFWDYRLPDSF